MAEERPAPTASDRWKPPPAAAEQLVTGPASERRPCEIQIWSGAGAMALTARLLLRSCAATFAMRYRTHRPFGRSDVARGRASCSSRPRSPSLPCPTTKSVRRAAWVLPLVLSGSAGA